MTLIFHGNQAPNQANIYVEIRNGKGQKIGSYPSKGSPLSVTLKEDCLKYFQHEILLTINEGSPQYERSPGLFTDPTTNYAVSLCENPPGACAKAEVTFHHMTENGSSYFRVALIVLLAVLLFTLVLAAAGFKLFYLKRTVIYERG